MKRNQLNETIEMRNYRPHFPYKKKNRMNEVQSMAYNISWSDLPWPQRLMLRSCICLKYDTLEEKIEWSWWANELKKSLMHFYSAFANGVVTIQDWWSIIFSIPFFYAVTLFWCKKMIQRGNSFRAILATRESSFKSVIFYLANTANVFMLLMFYFSVPVCNGIV